MVNFNVTSTINIGSIFIKAIIPMAIAYYIKIVNDFKKN